MKYTPITWGIILLLIINLIPITNSIESNKSNLLSHSDTGTLSGYISDTKMNPIEGAKIIVYFHESYEENYSNSDGYYHVTNIPICFCLKNASVSKEGYISESVLIAINETTRQDFILKKFHKKIYVGGNGPNNYSISTSDEKVIVEFYGPITVDLNLKVIEIGAQIAPGWIEYA